MTDDDLANLFRLDGRVAIVTGASSGLGDRFARVLHAAGAGVVLAARRADRLERLAHELPGAVAVPCDIAVEADLDRLVAIAHEHFGRIDVLVNNAGISDGPQHAEHESAEQFRAVMEVNLNAAFSLSRRCALGMLERGSGAIVNIASVHGLVAAAPNRQAAYAASKGGLVMLTRELACQWADRGVRVNAIAPGYFESELTAEMFDDESSLRWMTRNTPMRRAGRGGELDGALLLLASDAGAYITGQVLCVDGGWTAR